MPREASHRRWPRLLGFALGLALLIAYFALIRPALERRPVLRLIARYKAEPSQETAQALADLLDRQEVSQALGNEILELLVTPDVAVRSAYPAGEWPRVTASHPFRVEFVLSMLRQRRFIWAQGKEQDGTIVGLDAIGTDPEFWMPKIPTSAGVYPCALDCRVGLFARSDYPTDRPLDDEWPAAAYRCAVRIPLDIRLVEPERAERIERRTGQRLDAEMRAAFRPSTESVHDATVLPGGELWAADGQFMFEVGPLSENVGFRYVYRDQGGMTIDARRRTYRARAGGLPTTDTFPVTELRLPPGRYQGTALLIPDEAAAYPDAAIKTIWGGTIELPIEVVVRVTEKLPEERSDDAKTE